MTAPVWLTFRAVAAACMGLVLLTTAGAGSPTAGAAPGDGGLLADAPTLRLSTLGGDADLAMYGIQGVQTLTFPVPQGLTPAVLNAVVEMPANVRAGNISVTQGNRTVSRVELPLTDRAPIIIPLTGVEVDGNAVTVLLRSQLTPPPDYCLFDTNSPLRLAEATISFTGRELPPMDVADFLPPVLQRLTLFVPEKPTRAESDAAVRMTSAVVARYGDQALDVELVALAGDAATPPAPSQPLERQIVIKERQGSGVQLVGDTGVPSLLITGTGNELVNQSRLMSSDLSRLALASKAVAGPLKSSPQLPGNETTIRALGQPGVNATALEPQVSIGLDQTRLGRPVRDVRVHLKGSYTPLPASVGGQLVASVGGSQVDHWPTDSNGSIDRWVNVPNDQLTRYTNLDVAIDLSGNTGRCGEFQPVKITIDGATTVESSAANPPVPAGFQSLPQALMPRLQVGIEVGSSADTSRAVTIVEGLQRLSSLPIDTEVTPLADAVGASGPALLISPNGWNDQRIKLPVTAGNGGQLNVEPIGGGDPSALTLDPGVKFGSLQTVVVDDRTVLVATSNGSAAQLDSLLAWLDSDSRRWSRLSGAAVIAAPDRQPVTFAAPQAPDRDAAVPRSHSTWWLVGVAAAAATALLGWLALRRRRPT